MSAEPSVDEVMSEPSSGKHDVRTSSSLWGYIGAGLFLLGLLMLSLSLADRGGVRLEMVLLGLSLVLVGIAGTAASHRRRRTTRQDAGRLWWVGAAIPFGLGTWATFLFLGRRTGERKFVGAALVYGLTVLSALALNLAGGDEGRLSVAGAALLGLVWIAGVLHAALIRDEAG